MKKVLITGASGFIGSYLKEHLSGYEISTLSLRDPNWKNQQFDADVVIHCAGLAHSKKYNEADYYKINSKLTNEFAIKCKEIGVKKFIFFSTIHVYMAVSAKTPDAVRAGAIQKFRAGEIMQLVNVDLFGEGFDVPAVEVVSMARPTMSYGLFVQQFGRALRTAPGKSHGIILDHVGNVQRHGLPDAPRQWSLYNENYGKRGKRDDDGVIPVTSCPECFAAYERVHNACPHCGHVPEPAGRSLPEQLDGDLIELDPSVLAEMRGEIDGIDGDAQVPVGADAAVTGAVKKRWRERQEAQQRLRDAIALWAGMWRDAGEDDSTIHRRFFLTFGTDVMTAQTLNAADAAQLEARVSGT